VHRAEKSFKADAKQILFRNIQRRGYYKVPDGRYLVYADQADMQKNTLSGVVVAEVSGNKIKKLVTAEKARVNFNPHERFNEVQITAYNTYQIGSDEEGGFSVELMTISTEFGSLLGDDVRFKKINEMKKIRDVDLMLFYPVEKLARDVYAQFTTELLAEDIAAKTAGDPNSFYELHSGEKFVKFTTVDCNAGDEEKVNLSGGVVVIESDLATKQALRKLQCSSATLHIEGDKLAPTLTMELYNPTWQRADGTRGLAHRVIIRGLIIDKFATKNVWAAINPVSMSSALRKRPSKKLLSLENKLQRKIQRTLAEIGAEMHSRLVFGIGCVPLIMIGIGLGIILKGGHLLSAFGASVVPAAVLIICIMSGFQLARNPSSPTIYGLSLMWVGLAILVFLAVIIYRKLLKN
jgi:lipopolysaccharide export LptBFGC system permease protein LptF